MENVISFILWDWPRRLERLRSFNISINTTHLKIFIMWWYDLNLLLDVYEFLLEINFYKEKWFVDNEHIKECFSKLKYLQDRINKLELSYIHKLTPNLLWLTDDLLINYI